MTIAVSAPSTHLPSIGRIQTYSAEDLAKAVCYLRLIYNPDVRGIRRVDRREHTTQEPSPPTSLAHTLKPGSFHPSNSLNADLETLRSDAFERAYAIRWLTALVSQVYQLLEVDDDAATEVTAPALEALLQQASALLAICAGTASAGTITRTFRFHGSVESVEVQLTDVPLENQDYGSVGAQTWGSACLLAEMLVEDPSAFGLRVSPSVPHLRVLELGAGTGLVSVALGKLLGTRASVVATDFHPSVLANLQRNVAANFASADMPSSSSVSAHFLDWAKFPALAEPSAPFGEPFDYVFGADIIYEAEHARWIKNCVEKLLRRPTPARPRPAFHLVIPLRPTHTLESSTVETVFPLVGECEAGINLATLSKDVIVCEASGDVRSRNGVTEEVEYVHYVIGWRS